MSNIKNKLEERAQQFNELSETITNESIKEQVSEFAVLCDLAAQSVELRHTVNEDIKSDCADLFHAQDSILETVESMSQLLDIALSEDTYREDLSELEDVVECITTFTPKLQGVVEGMIKANTQLGTVSVRTEAKGVDKLDESVVATTASLFEKANKYIKGMKQIFSESGVEIEKQQQKFTATINNLKKAIVNEDHIKGEYFCIVQPGYAIFGIGKTADEAWKDAEQWADETDENWKNSFKEMACSEKLYNYVAKNGTPDDWEEHNDIAVLPEELEELEEAVKQSQI